MPISNSTQVRSSSLDLPRNDTQPAPAPRQRSASMTGPRPSGGALLGALSNAPAFPAHTGTHAPAQAGPLSTTSQPAGTAQPPSSPLPAPVRRSSLPARASSPSGSAIGRPGGGSRSLPGSGKLGAQRAALDDEAVPVLDLSGGGQSSEDLPVHEEPQPHTPASQHESAASVGHQEPVETRAAGKQPATSRSGSPLPHEKEASGLTAATTSEAETEPETSRSAGTLPHAKETPVRPEAETAKATGEKPETSRAASPVPLPKESPAPVEEARTSAAGKMPETSRSSSPLPLDKETPKPAKTAKSDVEQKTVMTRPHLVAHDIDSQEPESPPEATVSSSSSRVAPETRTLAPARTSVVAETGDTRPASAAAGTSAVAVTEDIRPASAAAISTNLSAALSRPGQIRSFISNVGDMLTQNPYGAAQPLKGWTANLVNAFSHEFVATGGATLFRELCSMATEAVLDKTGAGPETRGAITASLFTAAAMGNLAAMLHKYHTGAADNKTYAGHGAQIIALIATVATAAYTGKNDAGNGHLGQLAGILPSAIKSYAYLARDVINVFRPLEGNHDAGYERPVRGQMLNDVPYFGNQLAVNTAQGSSQWSATSYVDSLIHHTKTNAAIKGLFGYSAANAAGEGLDAIGGRVASEISTHGFTGKALDELKTLRVSWGKLDTSETSTAKQLGNKAAGAGIARLSLFLSLYAATAVVNHAVEGRGDWSAGTKSFTENALGALLIIAGCLPFAASTSSPSNRSNEGRTIGADNAAELSVMRRSTP
ncbi:hypothetical protein [Burkholderia ambifaria]|uniref:Uncharacterized protein n=1 Tax=Burkholderia ambifaria (strain ATCC BAA-244 / DSM 16087 / CCUG 44356 / LMG 19182 / AMMD) TaxID=339670 RepID=Q0B342_BURCM|nr:hypothetical protein [Burkholderia ambifaria]ABI91431.1 hypothetical protein Bamb_5885 [Burkholderia ambifaria AMMD]UZU01019.1 hypothetical protein OR987_01590 [Burkholderia ambifaria]UZU07571.1 hypothetical protein OR988_01590 [Burkholderia ambifaria]WDS11461.1 hypothetical protein OR984_01590 [Burkholderia ambifaria]WDS24594.1 hypothetical protein OR983_01595 [Burkholderia ambifaria]